MRSERQFCEQLGYNLLFKWFLDLNVDEEPFDASTFSKNRERLLEADVARAFLAEVVAEARRRRLLSADHFSVDGTLLEAWASLEELPPARRLGRAAGRRGAQPGGGLPGAATAQRHPRQRHRPRGAALSQGAGREGDALLHGAPADGESSRPGGGRGAERGERARRAPGRAPDGGAQHRGARHAGSGPRLRRRGFVAELRELGVTPHVASNDRGRRSAVDARTTRHPGYGQSQRRRKVVEEVFGWLKTVGGGRKLRYVGPDRNRSWLELAAAAFNLVRMARLEAARRRRRAPTDRPPGRNPPTGASRTRSTMTIAARSEPLTPLRTGSSAAC